MAPGSQSLAQYLGQAGGDFDPLTALETDPGISRGGGAATIEPSPIVLPMPNEQIPTFTPGVMPFDPPEEIVTIDRLPLVDNRMGLPGTQLVLRTPAAASVPTGSGIPIGIIVAVAALAFAALVPKGKRR